MKNTLIALLLVGSSSALFAQNTQNTTNNTNPNTTTNSSTSPEMNSTNNSNTTSPSTTPTTNTDASINTSTDVNTNTNTTVDPGSNTNPNPSPNATNMNTAIDNSTSSSVSSSSYNAYGTVAVDVPSTVRYSFQKDYPTVTNAQWYQTPNGQLRVMYKDANNQDMDVYYYGSSAQSYMVSLPVMQSFTSEDIVAKAKSMFGLNVYDINRVKAANNEYVYHLRLLNNGQVKSVWLSEQGNEVAATDVFRTAEANADIIQETNTAANGTNSTSDNTTADPASTNTNTNNNSNKDMNNSTNRENSDTNSNSTNSTATEGPSTSTEVK